jgi:hypothetical protein
MPDKAAKERSNPFRENALEGARNLGALQDANVDLKIHFLSGNVQMERFYH